MNKPKISKLISEKSHDENGELVAGWAGSPLPFQSEGHHGNSSIGYMPPISPNSQ